MRELVTLYLGWAGARGYEARVAAEGEEPARGGAARAAGPGVFGFLAGERGLHRRIDGRRRGWPPTCSSSAPEAVEAAREVPVEGRAT